LEVDDHSPLFGKNVISDKLNSNKKRKLKILDKN
jgi:hypothetical protein